MNETWNQLAGTLSTTDWALFLLAAFLIGAAKAGIKGMGLLIVPVMAWVFGGKPSTGIVLPLLIIADIFAVSYYNRHAEWKYIWRLLPAAIAGVLLGVAVGEYLSGPVFTNMLAIIILVTLVLMIIQERSDWMAKRIKGWGPTSAFGFMGGFTTMVGNAAGPLMSVYLLGTRIPKYAFIGTGAWFFMLINVFKVPFHVFVWKTIDGSTLLLGLSSLPAIALGILVGIKIVDRIPERGFRIFVMVMTTLIAIRLLVG